MGRGGHAESDLESASFAGGSEADLREADAEAAAVLTELHEHFLDRLRGLALVLGPIFVVAAVAVEAVRGVWRPLFLIHALLIFVLIGTLHRRATSPRVRVSVVGVLMLALCLVALFTFGPTLGVGTLFGLATLLSVFFWGWQGLVVALATIVVGTATIVGGSHLAGRALPGPSLQIGEWIRIGITVVGVISAIGVVFLTIQRSFVRAVRAEALARRREREADAERMRALESTLRGQRLESVGRLAGGVAHDVNNALMVVQMGVDVLGDEIPGDHPGRPALEQIDNGVARAASTVRKLLAFAKKSASSADESCQAREVLPALLDSIASGIPEDIRVELELDASAARVAISAPQLEQLLLNLILNARDAMKGGGTLSLHVSHDAAAGHDVIEVRDTGHGMEASVAERAFEPFFTTKAADGTGLGLAMVWGTVTGGGGSVELRSEPGAGASFILRLPCHDGEQRPLSGAQDALDLGGLSRARVLIVEDDHLLRRGLDAALRSVGARTIDVGTAAEAGRSLDEDPDFDMLITDVVIPGGGAAELIERFRARHPTSPVLVCSGYTDDQLPESVTSAAQVRFLRKPVSRQTLVQTASRMLRDCQRA